MTTESDELVVIGAGLMRTGTASLQAALQRLLHGKCYNLQTVCQNLRHADFWQCAISKDHSDDEWRNFFRNYKAAVGLPTAAFYRRLMEVYPEAKVILTVRDPRRWFLSVNATITASSGPHATGVLISAIHSLTGAVKVNRIMETVLSRTLGTDCDLNNERQMIAAYQRYVEEVKLIVPADKLLVFEMKEGWQPLCDFFGKEIPYEAFPHLNCYLVHRARVIRKRRRLSILTFFILLIGFFYFLCYWTTEYSN